MMVLPHQSEIPRFFSRHLMCPSSGISYPIPEPNSFSFNSPKGACPVCNGLGTMNEINLKKIIPDENVSIKAGGIAPIGEQKNTWIFKQLEIIAQRFQFSLTDAIKDIPQEAMNMILNGGKESFSVASKVLGITKDYKIDFEGISNFIKSQYQDAPSSSIKRWANDFMDEIVCSECNGSRLRKESLYFKIDEKNIADLSAMDLDQLTDCFTALPEKLSEIQMAIAAEIVKEIPTRLLFSLQAACHSHRPTSRRQSPLGALAHRLRSATHSGLQLVGV